MPRFLTTAAIALALLVGACSGGDAPSGDSLTQAPTPTSTGTAASGSASAGSTSKGSTAATASPSGASLDLDQRTPEAAMRSWLNAMFAGDTKAVCGLMATKGKAIAEVPQAVETCSSMIGTMLEQLRPLAPQFKGLTIRGATVTGDTATFEKATTKPAMAAQIIKPFKAVRINGEWYVTQG